METDTSPNTSKTLATLHLHDGTALEHLEQLGQPLLNHLLNFVVLVLLLSMLLLVLTAMVLWGPTVVLLSGVSS